MTVLDRLLDPIARVIVAIAWGIGLVIDKSLCAWPNETHEE